jgi:hypothetical protein
LLPTTHCFPESRHVEGQDFFSRRSVDMFLDAAGGVDAVP